MLHGIGVIHRDLKPSNILFGHDGAGRERVLVADLGLAKAVAQASGFTVAAGSPGYMAPEQARPGGGIDVRADVYALGALLHHMLTGAPPDPTAPAPPSARRPGTPPQVDRIVLRAMRPDPAQRWPSADAVVAALESAGRGVGDSVRASAPSGCPPSRRPRAGPCRHRPRAGPHRHRHRAPARPRRRRRALVGTLIAAALAGAAVVADTATGQSGGQIRVADATRTISVEVPSDWAVQLQDTGWDPARIGVTAQHSPALAVSPDLASWREPGTATPGVFVGTVPTTTGALSPIPDGCDQSTAGPYRAGALEGTVSRSRHCGGSAVSFTTAMLTVGAGPSAVLVQIKQIGEVDRTDEILASLQVQPG